MVIESGTRLTWVSLLRWHLVNLLSRDSFLSMSITYKLRKQNYSITQSSGISHPTDFFVYSAYCYLFLSFCISLLLLDLILDHPVVWQQTMQSGIPVFRFLFATRPVTWPHPVLCTELCWSSVLLFLLDFLFSTCSLRTARTHQNLLATHPFGLTT